MRIRKLLYALGIMLLVAMAVRPGRASASYAFYVGKDLTQDGVVLVGGTGEEVSSHWLDIVDARRHSRGATLRVGVTEEARIPGKRFAIAQPRVTYRYIAMLYSDFEGFPPPLINGGLNEHQVAVRDVWAPCRKELIAMTPRPQRGLSYSDLARLVLQRARTAREGVELIGSLIEKHGYATYGGNTHLIADSDEAWVVWEMAGGRGLWAAERLARDEVRALYPGSIGAFPLDYAGSDDHMGSGNLLRFAEAQGWYRRESGEPFDLWKVYGVQGKDARSGDFKHMSPIELENELRDLVPVTEPGMMRMVRDPRISDDEAGYGFVTSLQHGTPAALARAWIAPTSAVTAPFLPWWLGVTRINPEYRQHRYLTRNAASRFLHPDYQAQEATLFAGRLFKRILYYTCARPETFLSKVQATFERFERQSRLHLRWVERAAHSLLSHGKRREAHRLLTFYANTRAEKALQLGGTMADWLHAQLEPSDAFRVPHETSINRKDGEPVHCLRGRSPDRPASD